MNPVRLHLIAFTLWLAVPASATGMIELDLYVMSLCPYGMEAERELLPLVARSAGRVTLRIHYIADEADSGAVADPVLPDLLGVEPARRRTAACDAGSGGAGTGPFRSLHGQEEIDEGIRQLLILADYPQQHAAYVLCRSRQGSQGDWRRCASAAGVAPDTLAAAAAGPRGEGLFRANISAASRRGINLSPTLLVNGEEYAGDYRGYALARHLCALQGEECPEVPACGTDADCAGKPGLVTLCEEPDTPQARCVHQEPAAFQLIVLNTSACRDCSTGGFVRSTLELFPGAQLSGYLAESPEGAALMSKYGIQSLPGYIFGSGFEQSRRFGRVRGMVRAVADGFVVIPGVAGTSYWPRRPPNPGRTELFLPLWPLPREAAFLAPWREPGPGVEIHHLVPQGSLESDGGAGGSSDELRWRICTALERPEQYPAVAALVAQDPEGDWETALGSVGSDTERIRQCIASGAARREGRASRTRADSLELAATDVSALIGNQLLLRRARAEHVATLQR
jgi:hypothetical protein